MRGEEFKVGSRKSEVGSWKSEVGSWKSGVGRFTFAIIIGIVISDAFEIRYVLTLAVFLLWICE